MRSTLFYIPHADPFFDIPLFGVGWVLGLLVVIGVVLFVVRIRRDDCDAAELWRELPLYLLLVAAVIWGAPLVELRSATGELLGIPIRGYGVMVLTGIVLSVLLLVQESQRMGIHPDVMFSLCFWMIISGFVGARVFYVIEFWHAFSAPSWTATLGNIAKLTDGGLVVYGSFIGACLTVILFVTRHKLPLLAVADLLAPCLMLGLACGRIGCFLNGCCWGGPCDQSVWGVTFPQGSPPYVDQIQTGSLLDMSFREHDDGTYTISHVQTGGRGDRAGLRPGDVIRQLLLPRAADFNRLRHGETADDARLSLELADGRLISWTFGELPTRTAPIYPVQIFSSINAALLCLFLWAYYPFRRRDGAVAALLLTIYPFTRILLEAIRTDESPVFEFTLVAWRIAPTISQAISSLILLAVCGLWLYIWQRPLGSALPRPV